MRVDNTLHQYTEDVSLLCTPKGLFTMLTTVQSQCRMPWDRFLGGTVDIVDFGTNRTNEVKFIEEYHVERAGAKNCLLKALYSTSQPRRQKKTKKVPRWRRVRTPTAAQVMGYFSKTKPSQVNRPHPHVHNTLPHHSVSSGLPYMTRGFVRTECCQTRRFGFFISWIYQNDAIFEVTSRFHPNRRHPNTPINPFDEELGSHSSESGGSACFTFVGAFCPSPASPSKSWLLSRLYAACFKATKPLNGVW